jgi:hypothetical protein
MQHSKVVAMVMPVLQSEVLTSEMLLLCSTVFLLTIWKMAGFTGQTGSD